MLNNFAERLVRILLCSVADSNAKQYSPELICRQRDQQKVFSVFHENFQAHTRRVSGASTMYYNYTPLIACCIVFRLEHIPHPSGPHPRQQPPRADLRPRMSSMTVTQTRRKTDEPRGPPHHAMCLVRTATHMHARRP